ncbi:MAG: hypothetical protein ACLGIO_02435 [Acidimicrobiia bacterium]
MRTRPMVAGAAGGGRRIEVVGSAGDPCAGPTPTGRYLNAQP